MAETVPLAEYDRLRLLLGHAVDEQCRMHRALEDAGNCLATAHHELGTPVPVGVRDRLAAGRDAAREGLRPITLTLPRSGLSMNEEEH